jgi:hypothetical protein
MKRVATLATAMAAAGLIAGEAGAGGVQKVPTTLTGEFCTIDCPPYVDEWLFAGEVESPRRACRVGRRVEVHQQLKGADRRLGYGFSDSRGRWFVSAPEPDGPLSFEAAAPKKKLGKSRVCKAASVAFAK